MTGCMVSTMNQNLKELVRRAETWPDEAQEELAQLGIEIEAERGGAVYHPTPAELAAIDEADASGIASPRLARRSSPKPLRGFDPPSRGGLRC